MRGVLSLGMVIALPAFVGCSSTALTVDEHAPTVAQVAGINEESIEFISYADILTTPIDQSDNVQSVGHREFSADTKGLVVLTWDAFAWAPGSLEDGDMGDFNSIDIADIQYARVAYDGGLFIYDGEQEITIRPHSWSKYTGDWRRAAELGQHLLELGIDTEFPRFFSQSPDALRNDRSLEADYNSSRESGMVQDSRDQALWDWGASFGDEGVASPPP